MDVPQRLAPIKAPFTKFSHTVGNNNFNDARGSETINTNALKARRHTKINTSKVPASVKASITQFAHTVGNKNINIRAKTDMATGETIVK